MAFVAIVCLGLLAIDCWNSWESRSDQLRQMNVAASNLARAMAQQADDTIKKAGTVLVGMVERVEHDGTDPADLARLRKVLSTRVAELPQLDGLHIYDQDGNWVANSRSTPPENLNNAGREYFVFHRAGPTAPTSWAGTCWTPSSFAPIPRKDRSERPTSSRRKMA